MKKEALVLLSLLAFSSPAKGQTWDRIAKDFQSPPMNMRPAPLWFWNNSTVEPDELKRQMRDFREAGYGGLSILPFGRDFRPEYLTQEYFDVYRVCIEEAARLGMTLCIYDEYGFPSGTAGDINGDGRGRFKLKYPEHTNKRLDKAEYTPEKGKTFILPLPQKHLMAVVAMDTVNYRRTNLRENIKDGTLTWDAPHGAWKVMVFSCVDAGNSIMDYLSPEAADLYIGMTHEEYYKRFPKYFGPVIEGSFFDEPTMYYADGRTWTPAFNAKFEEAYGFSPEEYYPALWYDIGDETAQGRNYLFGFRSELFAEGYIKKVSDWSAAHGIHATGHLDNEEVLNAVGTSGDYMKAFKYLDIPGIDKIGGDRPAENFYKLISSAAFNWDHSYVMSETYGAMGDIDWATIYGIAMDQYAKGINMLIPHAVWYNPGNVTFRPELSLRNPIYADRLPQFNRYLSRLNVLMRNEARWMGDVAILYPIHTMQSGHYMDGPLGYYAGGVALPGLDYIDVSVTLSDSLGYDHMFLHPEVLDGQCEVRKGKLDLKNRVQHNSFSVLVVPSCRTVSLSNLKKIEEFARAGGHVIFTTELAAEATLAADNDAVEQIVVRLLKMKNVDLVKDPTAQDLRSCMSLSRDDHALRFTGDPVRNIHKYFNGKNVWFFANPTADAKQTGFTLKGKFKLRAWDPHTGVISAEPFEVKYGRGGRATCVKMELPPLHSIFLIEE